MQEIIDFFLTANAWQFCLGLVGVALFIRLIYDILTDKKMKTEEKIIELELEIDSLKQSISDLVDAIVDCEQEILSKQKKIELVIQEIVMSSPALLELSEYYPENRGGRVPLKIKMLCTVKSDFPIFRKEDLDLVAHEGQEYFVWCNSHGAISAILPNGKKLGIKPSECEIIEWHTNPNN